MSMEHPKGKRVNNGRDIEKRPPIKRPSTKRRLEAFEEEETEAKRSKISDTNPRFEEGVAVINREKHSNKIKIHEGSGAEISVDSSEKSIKVNGPNMHLKMEETDTGGRRITFPAFNDSRGFYETTIEMGKDHPTARFGDFYLKYRKEDGALEISTGEDIIKEGVNLGEQDKLIIRGFGENREVEYKYIDKYEFGNNRDTNINSVVKSKKATSEEAKKLIIEWAERNYGKLFGGPRGVINIVREFKGFGNIPEITVEA